MLVVYSSTRRLVRAPSRPDHTFSARAPFSSGASGTGAEAAPARRVVAAMECSWTACLAASSLLRRSCRFSARDGLGGRALLSGASPSPASAPTMRMPLATRCLAGRLQALQLLGQQTPRRLAERALHRGLGAQRQAEQLDEAARRRVQEAVLGAVVGGQVVAVERLRALAPHHPDGAAQQAQAHLAGDELLRR